jgi:hypothetical protein
LFIGLAGLRFEHVFGGFAIIAPLFFSEALNLLLGDGDLKLLETTGFSGSFRKLFCRFRAGDVLDRTLFCGVVLVHPLTLFIGLGCWWWCFFNVAAAAGFCASLIALMRVI